MHSRHSAATRRYRNCRSKVARPDLPGRGPASTADESRSRASTGSLEGIARRETMVRNAQEDLEERIFARLDPGGELGTLLSALRALTGNAWGRGLLGLLAHGAVDL